MAQSSLSPPEIQIHPASPGIHIRRATLADAPIIGLVGARGYLHAPISDFLYPHRHTYPVSHLRACQQRSRQKLLSPRFFSYVACLPQPAAASTAFVGFPFHRPVSDVVGVIHLCRMGDGAFAQGLMHFNSNRRKSLWACFYWAYDRIHDFFFPDLSESRENVRLFEDVIVAKDDVRWWGKENFPEYENRYHVLTLVVDPEFQRLGIGRMLLEEAFKRARSEGVAIGLAASPEGFGLYKQTGFRKRADFTIRVDMRDPESQGFMVWEPEGFWEDWKERKAWMERKAIEEKQ